MRFMSAYQTAGRKLKHVTRSELCLSTGYDQKYAIRLLNGPPPAKLPKPRVRGRRLSYGQQVLGILRQFVKRQVIPGRCDR